MKLLAMSVVVVSLLGVGVCAQTDDAAVTINLGTADKFALLGGSGITNVRFRNFHNW